MSSLSSIEADHHRDQLLAEAETHRLAVAARAARKRATRRNAPPEGPPPESSRPQTARPRANNEANSRYAVSR